MFYTPEGYMAWMFVKTNMRMTESVFKEVGDL